VSAAVSSPEVALKVCSCGAHYDRAGWDALPLLKRNGGIYRGHDGVFELRNCETCHTTLAVSAKSLVSQPKESEVV